MINYSGSDESLIMTILKFDSNNMMKLDFWYNYVPFITHLLAMIPFMKIYSI